MNEDEEFEFRLRAEKEAEQETVSNTPQGNGISQKAAIGVGIAGAGALAYGAARAINKPYREMKPLDNQLKAMASQIPSSSPVSTQDVPRLLKEQFDLNKNNIPSIKDIDKRLNDIASGRGITSGSNVDDLPKLLDAKQAELNSKIFSPSMQAINAEIGNQTYQINNSRKLFDQNILNPKTDDIAKHIADNYKEFTNSGYESYRNAQNSIESIIEQSGKTLQSDDIINGFLNKTIDDSIRRGVPEHLLTKLKKLSSAFESEGVVVDLLGNKFSTSEPIPFSQVKGNVAYLLRELPDGARHALADNWSSYMGRYVPQEARAIFDTMQQQYAKFAQARNTLFDLVDRDTGSFNTKTLSTRLQGLAKNNADAGLTQLLDSLSNGTEISKPITGLRERIPVLSDLRNQRNDFYSQIEKLRQHRLDRIKEADIINATLKEGIAKHKKVMSETKQLLSERSLKIEMAKQENMAKVLQAEKLISQKTAIAEKYPWRIKMNPKTLVKGVTSLAKFGGKLAVGLPMGVVGGEMEKRGVGYDPAEAFHVWYTMKFGKDAEKKVMEEKYQSARQKALSI